MTVAVGAQNVDPTEMGGLTGWVAGVIDSLGVLGVGLLVFFENIVPPVPSEIVLSMAGYLAGEGKFNVVAVWAAATAGSVVGAALLYWLGAALGEDRLKRWLDRVPLVELDDLERADRWFERHARATVLFGRMVPVVRSLVSIPAGANRMPVGQFLALTTLGSGIWNALFVGLGFALGSRWQQIDRYSTWFDLAILAFFAVTVVSWAVKRIRKRRAAQPANR
ncbi:DedA family protein [Solwaraspora sp. WMMD1047]|uniref:DedA family protein n=1 Tax=Solwaraspora sp. WMMD1047 TaxID=3016102 RepID=UPI002417C529|nr:DedA family protein [Solwaraspora sp. WMMD1047]MDG4828708.1 DedA family protein [Solwaraspora sp. WMMD1047]